MVKVKTKVKAGGAKAAAKAAKATKAAAPAKTGGNVDKQRAQVAAQLKKGVKYGDIAEQLGVTPGRARYLQMLNEVESGDAPAISTAGSDDAIAKRIVAARDKQDEYSSWGWISARTGIPEPRVKALAEAGGATVRGTHIASSRAAARDNGKPAAKAAKAATGKTKVKAGKAKAAAANPSA